MKVKEFFERVFKTRLIFITDAEPPEVEEYIKKRFKQKGDKMMGEAHDRIENNFTYHAPKGDQEERYSILRLEAKNLAFCIEAHCPNSREKSLAMTKLEEAAMWANAAIARNE